MNRMNLLYEMDDLLGICKTCSVRNNSSIKPCNGCKTYQKLNRIGIQLEEERRLDKQTGVKKLSVPLYQDYKAKGMNQSAIAKELDCTPAAVSQWVKKNIKGPEKVKQAKVIKETKSTAHEKSEYELNRLQQEIKQKDEEIKSLKGKLQNVVSIEEFKELQDQYKTLETANRLDLLQKDTEIEELNEKYHLEHQQLIEMDRELENKSELLKVADSSYGRLEEETSLLRKLMMVYIPN